MSRALGGVGRLGWQRPGAVWAQLGAQAASVLGTTSHGSAAQLGTWVSGSPGGLGRIRAGFSLSFRDVQNDRPLREGRRGALCSQCHLSRSPRGSAGSGGLRHQTGGWGVQTTQDCPGRVATEAPCRRPQLRALSPAPNCQEKTCPPRLAGLPEATAEGHN